MENEYKKKYPINKQEQTSNSTHKKENKKTKESLANNKQNNSKPLNTKNSNKYYKTNKNKQNTKPTFDTCPLCSKEIKEPLTAIIEKITKKNAHFNCITLEVKKNYPTKDKDNIYYIGSGAFALVKEKRFKNKLSFTIKEKIQYCEKTKK